MRPYLYYLHTNGDVIGKPIGVLISDPHYFDSPFVVTVWKIDMDNRAEVWSFVLDLAESTAKRSRVKELVDKWKLTPLDYLNYLAITGDHVDFGPDGIQKRRHA